MKKGFILSLHCCLGFFLGIFVFIQGITGAIYCFRDEINDLLFAEAMLVEPTSTNIKLPSEIMGSFLHQFPGANIQQVNYFGLNRTVQLVAIDSVAEQSTYFFNPYTLKLLKSEKTQSEFFQVVRNIHMYLGLPKAIGKPLVGVINTLLLLILLSGLYVFWNRKSKPGKAKYQIKWSASYKRLVYDLHNVIGFYLMFFAVLLCLTGLLFSFDFVRKSAFQIANLGKGNLEELFLKPPISKIETHISLEEACDKAFQYCAMHSPNYAMNRINLPTKALSLFRIRSYPKEFQFRNYDDYYFARDGEIVLKALNQDLSRGKQFVNSNFDLHSGIMFGKIGKVIWFLAALGIASLPITGYLFWIGKLKKKRKINNLNR